MMKLEMQQSAMSGIEDMFNNMLIDATEKLAKEFDFDVDKAKEVVGVVSVTVKQPSSSKKQSASKKPKQKPIFHLPFCGAIHSQWCHAMKKNHGLYTQCQRDKLPSGDLCSGCQKLSDNGNAVPLINQRVNNPLFKDKNGKPPVSYGNFMVKHSITREQAIASAAELGWTIPEEQFKVIKGKPGRKPKKHTNNVAASDTDDEKDIFKEIAMTIDKNDNQDTVDSDDEQNILNEIKSSNLSKPNASKRKFNNDSIPVQKKFKVVDVDSELDSDPPSDSESESELLDVEPFSFDGSDYLIDSNNNIYDIHTENIIGILKNNFISFV
tara:strand:+ start:1034 stop:2005 length:972 start_codon:yes stop_codon:yes gene_type:complete